jgi:hypothetical protein
MNAAGAVKARRLLRHADHSAIRVGMRLKCVIAQIAPGFARPCFAPAGDQPPK